MEVRAMTTDLEKRLRDQADAYNDDAEDATREWEILALRLEAKQLREVADALSAQRQRIVEQDAIIRGQQNVQDEMHRRLAVERERADAAESLLASIADTVASAHRNTNLPDPKIPTNFDCRELIWQLS